MDYEKKYKEALERARQIQNTPYTAHWDVMKELVEDLFPELAESENERIRKHLIGVVELYYGNTDEQEKKDCLAWLEKQGEQKPTDKVEPKFEIEEGKWYVCIRDLLDNYANKAFCKGDIYLSTQNGSLIPSNSNVPFEVVCPDTYFKDWTIQDAKDGDVLSWDDSKCIALFKNIYDEESFNSYGLVGHCTGTFELRQSYHDIEGAHPATKEQRDLLFQKMKEAGYEWDADEKQLKKIVQIPADLKTKAGNWYVCEIDVINENMVTAFRRGEFYYCPKDGYLDVSGTLFEVGGLDVFRLATEKEIPQPKQEWSEEDEEKINEIIDYLDYKGHKTDVEFLKSLRDRFTWKPSGEQIMVLAKASETYCGIDKGVLYSLYNDLKKLREE